MTTPFSKVEGAIAALPLRRINQRAMNTISTRAKMPPTTPPAITPMFSFMVPEAKLSTLLEASALEPPGSVTLLVDGSTAPWSGADAVLLPLCVASLVIVTVSLLLDEDCVVLEGNEVLAGKAVPEDSPPL